MSIIELHVSDWLELSSIELHVSVWLLAISTIELIIGDFFFLPVGGSSGGCAGPFCASMTGSGASGGNSIFFRSSELKVN